ncbi:MAG: DUF4783 domain-containing protein [Bacteroidales bacterium]|jgi:hypothetical protein|nr:DUF4783 domain-containing protein [Bacteroidales bacterium]
MKCSKILIAGLFWTCVAFTQTQNKLPADIVRALETGNSKEISKHFYSSVELILTQSSGVYGKSQAEKILKNFFDTNGPNFKYKDKHGNGSKDDSQRNYIGDLTNDNGIRYRISIYMKNNQIHQLRLEIGEQEGL